MKRFVMLGFGLAASISASAKADETPFGYSYTADTEEPGETELGLWATDRRGKGEGHYDAQDYKLEVEHGFSERFQIAGYAKFISHHVRGLEPDIGDVHRSFAFQGGSLEFKYRLLDEGRHGIGFALYAEPGWSRIHSVEGAKGTEYELELKVSRSKHFLANRLVWAGNLTFEPEWEREQIAGAVVVNHWERELKIELTSGLAYRIAPHWFAGVEGRYSSVYPDWTHGLHREASAVFAGPTVAFNAEEWSASLTFLPQLFGSPSPGGSRSLGEYEKREVRLKISHEF